MAHFEFADFVDEFKVEFTVTHPGAATTYDDNGRLVKGADTGPVPMAGILLPFGPDERRRADNGNYTDLDRKVYVTEPLGIGVVIHYKGESFTIDRKLPYDDYADVYIYYARGKGAGQA